MRLAAPRRRSGAWARAFAFALLAGARCDGVPQNQLQCEDAYGHLAACCGGLHPPYGLGVCGTYGCESTDPYWTPEEVRCIRETDCDAATRPQRGNAVLFRLHGHRAHWFEWHLGAGVEWIAGRWRLGGSLRVGVVDVSRPSRAPEFLDFTIGLFPQLTVNLVRRRAGALYVGLRGGAELVPGAATAPPLMGELGTMFGYRY